MDTYNARPISFMTTPSPQIQNTSPLGTSSCLSPCLPPFKHVLHTSVITLQTIRAHTHLLPQLSFHWQLEVPHAQTQHIGTNHSCKLLLRFSTCYVSLISPDSLPQPYHDLKHISDNKHLLPLYVVY